MKRNSIQKRIARFLVLSGMSFTLNLGLTFLFVSVVGMAEPLGYALTLAIVFCVNFTTLRYYVYGETALNTELRAQLRQCLIVAVSTRVGEWLLFTIAVEGFGVNYLITVVSVQVVSAVFKFAIYDQFVFNTSPKSSPDKPA